METSKCNALPDHDCKHGDCIEAYADFSDPEPVQCPACGGEGGLLGTLGRLTWFRCRYCGMDYSRQLDV